MKALRLCFALALVLCGTMTQMSAHYINVGQGDSILLEFKKAAILIDAGGEARGDTRDRDQLIDYLNKFFVRRADLNRILLAVIISHPHIDHTRNVMPVLRTFKVNNFIDGGNMLGSGFPQLWQARKFAASNSIRYRKVTDREVENRVAKTTAGFLLTHCRSL